MKKKLIIAVAALLLAVLIVPIPAASYDDGGTREYKALTYKIVKWNRLYEGDLCYNATRFYFGKDKSKPVDELWLEINPDDAAAQADSTSKSAADLPTDAVTFRATVLAIEKGSVTVAPDEGTAERNSADAIVIPKKITGNNSFTFPDVAVGDLLEITYDGMIAETYPAQIDVIYAVTVVSGDTTGDTTQVSVSHAVTTEATTVYNAADTVHYIRSGCAPEKTAFPYVVVIRSKEELTNYYNENKAYWDFDENQFDTIGVSFKEAIAQYDDAYFKENALVMVVTSESSGSYKYQNAKLTGNAFTADRLIPQVSTCDVAHWHIILEVSQSHPALGNKISITFNDVTV